MLRPAHLALYTATLASTVAMAAAPSPSVTPISIRDLHDPSVTVPIHEAPVMDERESHPRHRPAHFDVQHYDLDLAVDPVAGQVVGKVRVDFRATAAMSFVDLDAMDMQIERVTDAAGVELPFDYDGEVVVARLAASLPPQAQSSVTIEYRALLPQSLFTTGPDATDPDRMPAAYTYTQPEGSPEWFPCLDRPSDKATLTSAISVPESFNALSNGNFLGVARAAGQATYRYQMDYPIATYLVSLAIGRYDVLSIGNVDGKALTLWAPPHIREAAVVETARTGRMMEVFGEFTGTPYPFDSYAQSVAQAYKSSMEHQSATTMGGWRIAGDGSGESVVAHELAHQWFGDWITCNMWGELWLNEGFASYLPYVFFATEGEATRALGQIDYWRYGYFNQAKTTVHPLSSADPDVDAIFDSHAYEKGALVIHLMRHVARELATLSHPEPFTLALQEYMRARGTGNATNYDLQAALERTTGASWQLFFDQWVRSPGHPVLALSSSWADGVLTVRVEQTQFTRDTNKWRTFTLPLTLEAIGPDGQATRRTFDVYDDVQTLRWEMASPPSGLVADPDWVLPAEISLGQTREQWLAVLTSAADATARISALRALHAADGGLVTPELQTLILNDASVYLKSDALVLFSGDTANRVFVLDLHRNLSALRSNDIATLGALARTEEWLVRTLGRTPGRDEESRWRNRFLASSVVAERKALLGMLEFAARDRAQQFARDRLAEPQWVTQDRSALIDVLTKAPSDASVPFIDEAVGNASPVYLNQILKNLTAAAYDRPALVPDLVAGAHRHAKVWTRVYMIGLLAKQTSSRDAVCPELVVLASAGRLDRRPDFLAPVRDAAVRAQTALGCNP